MPRRRARRTEGRRDEEALGHRELIVNARCAFAKSLRLQISESASAGDAVPAASAAWHGAGHEQGPGLGIRGRLAGGQLPQTETINVTQNIGIPRRMNASREIAVN